MIFRRGTVVNPASMRSRLAPRRTISRASSGIIQRVTAMKRVMGLLLVVMLAVTAQLTLTAGSVPVGKAEDVGLSTERL